MNRLTFNSYLYSFIPFAAQEALWKLTTNEKELNQASNALESIFTKQTDDSLPLAKDPLQKETLLELYKVYKQKILDYSMNCKLRLQTNAEVLKTFSIYSKHETADLLCATFALSMFGLGLCTLNTNADELEKEIATLEGRMGVLMPEGQTTFHPLQKQVPTAFSSIKQHLEFHHPLSDLLSSDIKNKLLFLTAEQKVFKERIKIPCEHLEKNLNEQIPSAKNPEDEELLAIAYSTYSAKASSVLSFLKEITSIVDQLYFLLDKCDQQTIDLKAAAEKITSLVLELDKKSFESLYDPIEVFTLETQILDLIDDTSTFLVFQLPKGEIPLPLRV
jgi:hypothetical protein